MVLDDALTERHIAQTEPTDKSRNGSFDGNFG